MKKLCNLIIGMMLLCSMSAFAKLTLECEPQAGTVVKGYSQTTTQKLTVYATSEGEKITNLSIVIPLPDGLNLADGQTDGDTDSVIFNYDTIIATNAIVGASVFAKELVINFAPTMVAMMTGADVTNLQSGVRAPLFEIEFTVDLDATEAAALNPQFTVEECLASNDDVECDTDNLKLNLTLLRNSYNFATKDGALVELAEDAATVEIAATDTTLFTAEVWSVDASAMVATDAVEFIAATASNDGAGTVAIEGGKIAYTPAENYNGEFTINYTAKFTGIANAEVEGALNVKVNPVNDAPVIAFVAENVSVNEGETLTFEMSFADVDTAWDAFTKTVTLGGVEVIGEWTAGKVITTRAEGDVDVYTFTATDPVGYDAVVHPAKTATAALVVTIDDNAGDDGSVGTAEADATINDVDQATDFGATAITIAADANPAVFGSKLTAEFTNAITDADDDEAEIAYQWYRNGAAVAGETATTLNTAVKKGEMWQIKATATVKPYGDEIAAQEEFPSNEIVIGNTAPTTADAALFIRKTDGAEATGTVEITMADVDDDALEIVIKTQGTKGTAEVVGNTIKYTVTDTTTEFYDNDADVVKFVVNDGTEDSEEATLTVTYRANPPAEITVTTAAPEAVDEVDGAGEAVSFEIAISATDSDEVSPYGIAAIEWQPDEGLNIDSVESEGIDTAAATSKVVVKTNSYETLDGADRPASKEFTVKALVTDKLGAVTTETFKIIVNDVDRKVPANFTIAFDPAAPKTADDVTAMINGAPEDPDGDAIIGYKYAWTVNGAEVAAEGAVLAAANFRKGDTVAVKAAALTKPYDAEEVENDFMEEAVSVEIGNTVPTLALVDDAKVEATEDEAKTVALNELVAAADPDVADGVDKLTFEVTANFGEDVGTLVYDAEAGNVTFTPAENYNTEGLDALPTFSVTVSDGVETTAAVDVEISVAAVNDAPTVTVVDVYVQPTQAGQEITATFAFTAGPDDEAAQQVEIEDYVYTAPEDGKVLLNGDIVTAVDNDAKTISFTFPIAENAEIGATGTVDFIVKDDAGANSEINTFKIILSGTPWYPTIALPCDHDTEGVVARITVDGKQTDIVVKEKTDGQFVLTPAIYYNSGFKGFDRNAQGDIAVYHWTAKGGTGEKCADVENGVDVPDYQAPGKPSIEGTENPNAVKVSAPLASGFSLEITDAADGSDVAAVAQDFIPALNGQMETVATVTLAGLESGKTYNVVAWGINPMGEYGEQSEVFVIDLTNSEGEDWPGDGEFFPPQNWTTTIATNTTDITFKWPVNAKADNYTLRLLDGDGNVVSVHSKLVVNSINVTGIPAGSYRWVVETSNGESSDMMTFTIVKNAGDDAVIKGGIGEGNMLLLEAENLTIDTLYQYDVIYFDAKYNQWAYQLFTGKANPRGLLLELTGDDVRFFDAANYIMLRPHAKGSYQTLLINAN